MTIVAGTVALNISYYGLLLMALSITEKKVAPFKKHIQFKTRGENHAPVYDQTSQN